MKHFQPVFSVYKETAEFFSKVALHSQTQLIMFLDSKYIFFLFFLKSIVLGPHLWKQLDTPSYKKSVINTTTRHGKNLSPSISPISTW